MTENSNAVDTTDLDSFSAEFFGGTPQPQEDSGTAEEEAVEKVDNDADDTSPVDDTDATNDADDEPKAEGDDEPEEKPKKKSAQERINELTRQRREAERQNAEWERRFNELEARLGNVKETPAPASTDDTGAPDPDALNEDGSRKYELGDYDPQFIRDYHKFAAREELRAAREEADKEVAAKEAQAARTELNTEWNAKLDAAEEGEFADIREKGLELVESFNDLSNDYQDYLAQTIMGMDKGIEVFYYLANNPEEARDIVSKGATGATIALGRIEAKFLNAENGNVVKPKVSKAPPPPPAVNRGSNGRFEVPGDTEDLDAFEAVFFNKKR